MEFGVFYLSKRDVTFLSAKNIIIKNILIFQITVFLKNIFNGIMVDLGWVPHTLMRWNFFNVHLAYNAAKIREKILTSN